MNRLHLLSVIASLLAFACPCYADVIFETTGVNVSSRLNAGEAPTITISIPLAVREGDAEALYNNFKYNWGRRADNLKLAPSGYVLNWTTGENEFHSDADEISKNLLSLAKYTFTSVSGEDSFKPFAMAIKPPSDASGKNWLILFRGKKTNTNGFVSVELPDGWKIQDVGGNMEDKWPFYVKDLQPVAPISSFDAGYSDSTVTLQFKASAFLGGQVGTASTISAEASVPLTIPGDARNTPGATNDSSGKVADFVNISFNRFQYQKNGGLIMFGFHARATGELRGSEFSLYGSQETWFAQDQLKFSAELELGFRDGNSEWETLTTQAPDRGSTLARLGIMIEFRPITNFVNKNSNQGLQFFIRGRGWADSYKYDSSGQAVRFRPFIDGELYFNIGEQYRLILLRHEQGYLPPDLSRYVNRWYVGIGARF